ncbi:MAG: saccharopine dehydrogenase NADP-binding domain-containing protein [Firmicutes bacterium]|nr:saccharopine dehydrogenase NADP-binding domain-containing protein [Bacillota bacterium]
MKLAILGLGGVGRVIAKSAARTGKFAEVICADRESEVVETVISDIESNIFKGIIVDASDLSEVTKLASEVDILINATVPRFNLIVMEACLAGKCHYMDLACETLLKLPGKIDISEQLALDERYKNADLLALCGIGIDPGCSNIFARYLADRMDSVEEILVRDADVSYVEGYELALYFSPDTFIDECVSEPPLYFEKGSFLTKDPLQVIEEFVFPDPVGRVKVYGVSHEEAWTLPRYINKEGLQNCNFGYGLADELVTMMDVLRMIGLDSDKPIDVNDVQVVPRDVVTALLPRPADLAGKIKGNVCVGTLVRGYKDGKKVAKFMYNTVNHEEAYRNLQEQGTSFQTGIPAALAADLLAEGFLKTRGAVPPEALDPEPFVEKLPDYGMMVAIEDRS